MKCFLWISLISLLGTKSYDVYSTIRFVRPQSESNPIARKLFKRFGFGGGLLAVALVWILVVSAAYVPAFKIENTFYKCATALLGFVVAIVQFQVAQYNVFRKPSRLISAIFGVHATIGRRFFRK